MPRNVLVLAGTRPEAIKLAPVVRELRATPGFAVEFVSTGQHREMLAQALVDFGMTPDVDLAVMTPGQTLAGLSARLFERIDGLLVDRKPEAVLVQGDTTTAMVGSLCAFYRGTFLGHVEAGLRSHDRRSPFPEEINRRVAGLVADLHFAPTPGARDNLIAEGAPPETVLVTGNTVVDALLWMRELVAGDPPPLPQAVEDILKRRLPLVLITGHRRESFGQGFADICKAVAELAERHEDMVFVYPVHLNPQVKEPVTRLLGGRDNVHLLEPLSYKPFVRLLDACRVVLTDSGGIQEEAPSLGKPVVVMRKVTERTEGVAAGTAVLVGTDPGAIYSEVHRLLTDPEYHSGIAKRSNPYGDGRAAAKITRTLLTALK
jgi:UDP-N-acetylglucosamine 2-epimerase